MPNNNCLDGYRCPDPDCRSEGPFWFSARIYADVLMGDDGTIEERRVSTEWEDVSDATCQECGHEDSVRAFKEENQ